MAHLERSTDGITRRLPRKNLDDFSQRPSLGDLNYGYSSQRSPQNPKNHKLDIPQETTAKATLIADNQEAPTGVRYRFMPEKALADTPPKGKTRFWRHRRQRRKLQASKSKLRRIIKWSFASIGLLVGLFAVFVILKSWTTLSSIIDRAGAGSPLLHGSVEPSELSGEGDGRVNIMILGIGGAGHPGGTLADTIIVASIDPFSYELGLLSIPRDMYVTIPGYGKAKINAAHAYGEQEGDQGIALTRETLEATLGITMHYYVRVDFQGFIKAVDAVGGVDITLDERVYDPSFDWEYGSHALDIGPGLVHLDGTHALLLSRARGAFGGVGVSKSDFSRSPRQRDIILALKDKILTLGTYKDPRVIISLLDAIGGHVRTDLQVGDMLRLRELAGKIATDKIISFGLDNTPENYLISGNINGASVQLPKGGDYSKIQVFVRQLFVDGFIKKEAAVVDILNGSSQEGLANEKAIELRAYGYTIGIIDNAPTRDYSMTALYDLTGKSPYTKRYLETRYGVIARSADALPADIQTEADLVLIIGAGNASTQP